MGQGYIMH